MANVNTNVVHIAFDLPSAMKNHTRYRYQKFIEDVDLYHHNWYRSSVLDAIDGVQPLTVGAILSFEGGVCHELNGPPT